MLKRAVDNDIASPVYSNFAVLTDIATIRPNALNTRSPIRGAHEKEGSNPSRGTKSVNQAANWWLLSFWGGGGTNSEGEEIGDVVTKPVY